MANMRRAKFHLATDSMEGDFEAVEAAPVGHRRTGSTASIDSLTPISENYSACMLEDSPPQESILNQDDDYNRFFSSLYLSPVALISTIIISLCVL